MPNLTDELSRRAQKIQRRPDLPGWFDLARTGGLVVLLVALVFMFFAEDTPPGGGVPVVAPPPPVTSTPPAPVTGPSGVPSADVVVIFDTDGREVELARTAVELARAAAEATFAGGADTLPAAPSTTAPNPARPRPQAVATRTVLKARSDGALLLAVTVDPDDGGPNSAVSLDVRLVSSDGRWLVSW